MNVIRGVGRFWYDFVVGDDWKIAVVVVLVLALGAGLVLAGVTSALLAALLALGVAAGFVVAVLIDVGR